MVHRKPIDQIKTPNYLEKRDIILRRVKDYQNRNRESIRLYNKEYYKKNRTRIREQQNKRQRDIYHGFIQPQHIGRKRRKQKVDVQQKEIKKEFEKVDKII
jgi:hypothetical protein